LKPPLLLVKKVLKLLLFNKLFVWIRGADCYFFLSLH